MSRPHWRPPTSRADYKPHSRVDLEDARKAREVALDAFVGAAVRRQTVEHPFGTMKVLDGSNALFHEKAAKGGHRDALNVLAYNMKRVMTILGVGGLLKAMRA
ncbi:hypothetical protein AB7M43_002838 [Bradyrhizobium elkanii]